MNNCCHYQHFICFNKQSGRSFQRFKYSLMLTALFLACFSFAIAPSPLLSAEGNTKTIEIAGRVFSKYGPLSGAVIEAYSHYADIRSGSPLFSSKPSDKDGLYKLTLPEGKYYFTARGTVNNEDQFAFHGNNPIGITSDDVWIPFMTNKVTQAQYTDGEGLIKGVITLKGKPLKNAYITAYLASAKTFKGLGFKTQSARDDGSFQMSLPVGEYVIVAKRMKDGGGVRPLQRGDLIGYFPGNPVEIRPWQDVQVEVPTYPRGDRTAFIDVPEIKDNDFTIIEDLALQTGTGIKGKVVDVNNKPLSGIYVLAYKTTSDTVFQMYHLSHGTQYSSKTDEKGNYFIPVDNSGTYYVVARNILGDGPHRDEIYGLFQGTANHTVLFKEGKHLENIDIVAGVTMDQNSVVQLKAAPTRIENPVIETDTTISENTIWAGVATINGVVSIKRGATLVLEPGTVVKFKKLDRDRNGIGDGEILVEGTIIAKGTPDRKIIFTSAEAEPKARDYSYVNILATETENIFEYCVFEYGFSGMQIHYSNATITDSLFHKNGEGLHFNTVNVNAFHNVFSQNGVGIKFSRLEGKVLIKNNLVTDNKIGIQFVHQHINAVDFDNLHKVLEPPVFVNNNIFNNKKYNFTIGDRQEIDIKVKDNWWGSDDSNKIADSIFDKVDDDELGQVFYDPFLTQIYPDAGIRTN